MEDKEAKDPISLERARRQVQRESAGGAMQRLRKVLCDPARLSIVEALSAAELCVNDLALAIGRAPAATSQHLKVLRDLGLVESRRQRTTVFYRLNPSATRKLAGVLQSLAASA